MGSKDTNDRTHVLFLAHELAIYVRRPTKGVDIPHTSNDLCSSHFDVTENRNLFLYPEVAECSV